MKPNVNPLCLPENRGEGEREKFLTLKYVDEAGAAHTLKVRAFAGCEEGDEGGEDARQWSANTRDDMVKMGLAHVFDAHHTEAAKKMLSLVFYPGEDGQVVARCPQIPGCISQGTTLVEAMSNIQEAVELCLESQVEEGWTLEGVSKEQVAESMEKMRASGCISLYTIQPGSREEWALLVDKAERSPPLLIPVSEIRPCGEQIKGRTCTFLVQNDVSGEPGIVGQISERPHAVVVLVVLRGKVLLCKFSSYTNADGMLPGGKLEPGETPHQAAIREFTEECGVRPIGVATTPALITQTHDGRPMWVFWGSASERDFPLDDTQYVPSEGYVRWVELADVLDYYRPQLRDAAKKIFASSVVKNLVQIKENS